MSDKDDTFLFILSSIQENIRSLENKIDSRWDSALSDFSSQKEKVNHLEQLVNHNTKIISVGNGKPSIVTQVFKLQSDVDELKKDMDEVKETSRSTLNSCLSLEKKMSNKTPKEVTVIRWKVVGAALGVIAAIVSGIVAILA